MTTETVQTQYGSVEIETVECDSCGDTIAKDDAYRFAMDNDAPNKQMNNAERNGYACEICVDEGPAGFVPDRWEFKAQMDWLFGIVLWPIVFMFSVIESGNKEAAAEYAVATVGAILWLVLPLLAYIYLI
jgi:hypothetical protein